MALTPEERVALLESSHLKLESVRADLLDVDGTLLEEFGDEVTGLSIRYTRSADGPNRSMTMATTQEMVWGRHRVAPYVTISGGGLVDVDMPLGVYATTSAPIPRGVQPREFIVQGYDLLYLMNWPLTQAYTASAGTATVLSHVDQLIRSRGINAVALDPQRALESLPEPRTWTITESLTVLDVANALLGAIGYDPLHMTSIGVATSSPILLAHQRPVTWSYDADGSRSTVVIDAGHMEHDYTTTPNVWTFYMDQVDREGPPVQEDGVYVVNNEHHGPSSITARGGAFPAQPERLDAVSHADLKVQGDRRVAEQLVSQARLSLETDANPYLGHRDVVHVRDSQLGVDGRYLLDEWTMDVFGLTMNHLMVHIEGVTNL